MAAESEKKQVLEMVRSSRSECFYSLSEALLKVLGCLYRIDRSTVIERHRLLLSRVALLPLGKTVTSHYCTFIVNGKYSVLLTNGQLCCVEIFQVKNENLLLFASPSVQS